MTTITPSYAYVDNTVLDPDGHNKNVYESSVTNEGILSTANGCLDSGNLSLTFKVDASHVQPGEATVAKADYAREAITCYSDAFARAPVQSYSLGTAPANMWLPVPGAGIRFYQPYQSSCALLSCSAFVANYHAIFGTITTSGGATGSRVFTFDTSVGTPLVGVALMLDGTILGHSKRNLPRTDALGNNFAGTGNKFNLLDKGATPRSATWLELSHLVTAGLSKGYHDIQLVLYMESMNVTVTTSNARWGDGPGNQGYFCRVHGAAKFGVRGAKVVSFL